METEEQQTASPTAPPAERLAYSVQEAADNNGTEWQHGVDLMENISIRPRRTAADLEFAVVECVPTKSGEAKNVLMDSDHSVRELLKTFTRDQRQVLSIWKDDVIEQVKEYLAEKYPIKT